MPHRFVFVDVDGDDLRAAFLAGANRVGHDIDLRGDGVGAPNNDAVRLRHFSRVDADEPTCSGHISRPCDADADCAVETGIAFGVREALNSVAHHETHRAGVEVWPHGFGSEFALDGQEIVSNAVKRLIPTDRRELPAALGADALERLGQPIRVVDTLVVTSDLRADDAGRVGLFARAMDTADALAANHLDVERANRRAVVRAD